MSKKVKCKQRVQAEKASPMKGETRRRSLKLVAPILLVSVVSAATWLLWPRAQAPKAVAKPPGKVSAAAMPTNVFKAPTNFTELCQMSSEELEKCDVALLNLLCAEGLPGGENLDVPATIKRLDGIAQAVKFETERHLYKFRRNPAEYENSEGQFRITVMATVLAKDLGIHYNPDRISISGVNDEPDEAFFANSGDVFIHGLCGPFGSGTCSSMPVFYAALGRRLGYPLKLVNAKAHFFLRWDDGKERFNIDATSPGFVSHPDSHYRQWPFPITPEEERNEGWLRSLTPVQEIAVFMSLRGQCLRAAKDYTRSLGAFAEALRRDPGDIGHQKLFARAEYEAFQAGALPPPVAIQYVLNTIPVPDGPLRSHFLVQKSIIQGRPVKGANEAELAAEVVAEVSALRAEALSHNRRLDVQAQRRQPGFNPEGPSRPE